MNEGSSLESARYFQAGRAPTTAVRIINADDRPKWIERRFPKPKAVGSIPITRFIRPDKVVRFVRQCLKNSHESIERIQREEHVG